MLRLKSDLHVFKLSKQLQKYNKSKTEQEEEEPEQSKSANDSGQKIDSD